MLKWWKIATFLPLLGCQIMVLCFSAPMSSSRSSVQCNNNAVLRQLASRISRIPSPRSNSSKHPVLELRCESAIIQIGKLISTVAWRADLQILPLVWAVSVRIATSSTIWTLTYLRSCLAAKLHSVSSAFSSRKSIKQDISSATTAESSIFLLVQRTT